MNKKHKDYREEIKKEHRFGFWNNPSYEEFIELSIKKFLFFPLAEKVIDLLGWEVVLKENDTIYARSKENWGTQGKINIAYLGYSRVRVSSESSSNQIWDIGKNSVRVKLFIIVFYEELEKLSKEEKEIIEKDFEAIYNWDNYEIPVTLPLPILKKVIPLIPIIGSLVAIIGIGMFAGFVDYKVVTGVRQFKLLNVPIVFEAVVALIFFFVLTRLCRVGNFTDLRKLKWLCIGSFLLYFLSTELTFYTLLKSPVDFLSFTINYYKPFFIESHVIPIVLNLGMILAFLFMIISFFWILFVNHISFFQIKRIPSEVFEFVEYLLVKNNSETQIRYELSKRGWKSEQAQNEVFEAIQGFFQGIELSK